MFFVSLHPVMKKVVAQVSALLLVIWYSLSVIGFDVHTCSTSGETFVATSASGFSCEDVHPEHRHHHGCRTGCACNKDSAEHDELSDSYAKKSCCTVDYQVITLTGTRTDDSHRDYSDLISSVAYAEAATDYSFFEISISGFDAFYKPRPGTIAPRDVQASYNIWRI